MLYKFLSEIILYSQNKISWKNVSSDTKLTKFQI